MRPYLTQPSRVVNFTQKARNLGHAAMTVAQAAIAEPDQPVLVPAEVEIERLGGCRNCPEGRWNPEGNAGLGECLHPKCGCTAYKLKFAALSCPLDPPVWKRHTP